MADNDFVYDRNAVALDHQLEELMDTHAKAAAAPAKTAEVLSTEPPALDRIKDYESKTHVDRVSSEARGKSKKASDLLLEDKLRTGLRKVASGRRAVVDDFLKGSGSDGSAE